MNLRQRIRVAVLLLLAVLIVPAGATARVHHRHHHHHHRHHHRRHHHRRHHRHHHPRSAQLAAASASTPTATAAAPAYGVSRTSLPGTFTPAQITGTTYYVSPTGSDSNSGTSPDQAWRTVDRVNRASLNPGDGVLFQGGATFGDDTLMPGWGTGVSGTAAAPVVFGSYGQGRAILPKGIWMKGESYLVLQNFRLGPVEGVSGTANNITVQGCDIEDMVHPDTPSGYAEIAIDATGSNWLIQDNVINRTGDSGLLLLGDHYTVTHNEILNTGLDPAITYGDHGIYLKATDSSVTYNLIRGYNNDGVSVRYRNSVVAHNTIADGEIGLAWFQYDTESGTSQWTDNRIIGDTVAGIYVSPTGSGGDTHESFVISHNLISRPSNAESYWVAMNLHPTSGTYTVGANNVQQ